jgi:hypothetical protein
VPARAGSKVALARLPLSFVANRGQLDRRVSFAVQGRDADALFTSRGVAYVLDGRYAVKVDFVGARPVRPSGQDKLPGIVSIFKGARQDWHAGIPTYRGIVYHDLWPGIDLVWSGALGRLKYDVVVHPGADLGTVKLRYQGAKLSLQQGRLLVRTPVRTLREGKPVGNASLAYVLHGNTVGFRADGYDRSRTLRIDPPSVLYAGFLGGSSDDFGSGIAVDASGAAYVTGYTYSSAATFPDTAGVFPSGSGAPDAFVAKVKPSGKALAYCGFLGGNGDEVGHGIAVDASGNAYVTGVTESSAATFPATPGALDQSDVAGRDDAYVAEVNPSGTALVYAGYLGGSEQDAGYAIAVDGQGRAYVTGLTASTAATFPDTPGALDQTDNAGGPHDAFVAKVAANGSHLIYARFLGGSGDDLGNGIAVDGSQHAYVTGNTSSSAATFPDTAGALDQSDNAGNGDAFVAKVSKDGKSLVYAGFLGGANADAGSGIAVGPSGAAFVIGTTNSTAATFPNTTGALAQSNNAGMSDAFVAKVSKDGTSLVYAGFLGGSGFENGGGITVDTKGRAFVTGSTDSTAATFPNTPGALNQPDNAGGGDAFVAKVKASGGAFAYAGFLGGSGGDGGSGIALDSSGNAYIAGTTTSTAATFPNTAGALDQSNNAGGYDAFVAKVGTP